MFVVSLVCLSSSLKPLGQKSIVREKNIVSQISIESFLKSFESYCNAVVSNISGNFCRIS